MKKDYSILLYMTLQDLEKYYNTIENKEHQHKASVKGIILSKTDYGVKQLSLFENQI